jgi:hypothetical protein
MKSAVLLALFLCLFTSISCRCEESPKPTVSGLKDQPMKQPEPEHYFNGAHQAIPAQDLLEETVQLEQAGSYKQADKNLTDVLGQVVKQPSSWWQLYSERSKCREHFDLSGATCDLLQAAIFLRAEAEKAAKKDLVAAVTDYSKIIGFYDRAMVLHEQEKAWAGRGVDLTHDKKYISEAVLIYDGAANAYQRQADLYLVSHHRDYYTADMAKAQEFKAKAAAISKGTFK